jgi:hypothetical protein
MTDPASSNAGARPVTLTRVQMSQSVLALVLWFGSSRVSDLLDTIVAIAIGVVLLLLGARSIGSDRNGAFLSFAFCMAGMGFIVAHARWEMLALAPVAVAVMSAVMMGAVRARDEQISVHETDIRGFRLLLLGLATMSIPFYGALWALNTQSAVVSCLALLPVVLWATGLGYVGMRMVSAMPTRQPLSAEEQAAQVDLERISADFRRFLGVMPCAISYLLTLGAWVGLLQWRGFAALEQAALALAGLSVVLIAIAVRRVGTWPDWSIWLLLGVALGHAQGTGAVARALVAPVLQIAVGLFFLTCLALHLKRWERQWNPLPVVGGSETYLIGFFALLGVVSGVMSLVA